MRALASPPAAAGDVAPEGGAVRAALHLDAVGDRDKGAQPVPRRPGRRVEIDLPRLDKLGYIVPDKSNSQIADEFRVVTPRGALQRVLREDIALERLIVADGFFGTFPPKDGTDGFFAAAIEDNTKQL